jgi:hypothetical protein
LPGIGASFGTKLLARDLWQRAEWWIALPIVLAASGLMIARSLKAAFLVDFYYLLVAGRMWGAGLDPYGAGFLPGGTDLLPPDSLPFAYPPNWWIIVVPLSALANGNAIFVWKLLNLAAAAAAAAALVRSAARLGNATRLWPALLFVLCTFASDIMWNAQKLGQTSLIMLLGFALLITGLTDKRRWLQVCGLAVLLLKPQIGLLFLLPLGIRREARPAAALALAVAAVSCLPILFTTGVEATVESARNFLHNLTAYGQSPWNLPIHMSGLPHLFAYLGIDMPAFVALVAACVTATWVLRPSPDAQDGEFVVRFWLVTVATLLSMVPSHAYDFILAFPCLLLLPLLERGWSRNLMLLSVALTWSATGFTLLAFRANPSADGVWMALRLEYDLLTAAGVALSAAAVCQLRSRHGRIAASRTAAFG